ncbi:MAG: STAS-like domain-containing protein [Pseudomonadota bacterium]
MVVRIADHLEGCDTNVQGAVVRDMIMSSFSQNDAISLDFSDVHNVTSSFVNTAFIEVLEHFGMPMIKSHLKITGANRQVAKLIGDRMRIEAAKLSIAA